VLYRQFQQLLEPLAGQVIPGLHIWIAHGHACHRCRERGTAFHIRHGYFSSNAQACI